MLKAAFWTRSSAVMLPDNAMLKVKFPTTAKVLVRPSGAGGNVTFSQLIVVELLILDVDVVVVVVVVVVMQVSNDKFRIGQSTTPSLQLNAHSVVLLLIVKFGYLTAPSEHDN